MTAARALRPIPGAAPTTKGAQHERRRRPKRNWPVCVPTGKQRFGERKDAKLALKSARHLQAHATRDGQRSSWTVCRTYRCEFCGGWHLTSLPAWRDPGQAQTDTNQPHLPGLIRRDSSPRPGLGSSR